MILTRQELDPLAFERQTGWALKPEGACRGEACVPLPDRSLEEVARRLQMPLVAEGPSGPWCLGPEVTPEMYSGQLAPSLRLATLDGTEFELASLLGSKVLLVAWAPW